MKNNQGFTLVGTIIIAGIIGGIVTAGVMVTQYRANRIEAEKISMKSELMSREVSSISDSSASKSAGLEFAKIENSVITNVSAGSGTVENPITTEGTGGGSTSGGTGSASCASPCHSYTDPISNTTSCIISDADCQCMGKCETCPVYMPDGPLNPALAGKCVTDVPTCASHLQLQCYNANQNSYTAYPKTGTCSPPSRPVCACPGGMTDCGTGVQPGDCGPGETYQMGAWGMICAPNLPSSTPSSSN